MIIAKIPCKVDNSWATKSEGWWDEWEYRIIDEKLLTPNVKLICQEKYRLIKNKIPSAVKKELQQAVKNGILFHIKKDGVCEECYYFLGYENLAINAVYVDAENALNALKNVLV